MGYLGISMLKQKYLKFCLRLGMAAFLLPRGAEVFTIGHAEHGVVVKDGGRVH